AAKMAFIAEAVACMARGWGMVASFASCDAASGLARRTPKGVPFRALKPGKGKYSPPSFFDANYAD
ncbi:MAG TPA: hypothetical protein VM662_00985, partial [Sphingomonas sp.]|nr:hypothetical protein [Sphingomonas sp.]